MKTVIMLDKEEVNEAICQYVGNEGVDIEGNKVNITMTTDGGMCIELSDSSDVSELAPATKPEPKKRKRRTKAEMEVDATTTVADKMEEHAGGDVKEEPAPSLSTGAVDPELVEEEDGESDTSDDESLFG